MLSSGVCGAAGGTCHLLRLQSPGQQPLCSLRAVSLFSVPLFVVGPLHPCESQLSSGAWTPAQIREAGSTFQLQACLVRLVTAGRCPSWAHLRHCSGHPFAPSIDSDSGGNLPAGPTTSPVHLLAADHQACLSLFHLLTYCFLFLPLLARVRFQYLTFVLRRHLFPLYPVSFRLGVGLRLK